MFRVLVTIVAVVAVASSVPLPSYFKRCKLDSNLNECVMKAAQETLPNLLNGDRKINMPSLNPLKVTKIEAVQGNDLTIILTEVELLGVPDVQVTDVKMDPKTLDTEISVKFPLFHMKGKYEINGKILVLPIKGNGPITFKMTDLEATVKVKLPKTKKADGLEYLKTADTKLEFTASKAEFNLDNLFNGDKALGDNTNKFMNENWKDVVQELGPPVGDAITQVISAIMDGVLNVVPVNELFIV